MKAVITGVALCVLHSYLGGLLLKRWADSYGDGWALLAGLASLAVACLVIAFLIAHGAEL
jgi:hypothetical protein